MTKPHLNPTHGRIANSENPSTFTSRPEPEPQGECQGHVSKCRGAPPTRSPGQSLTPAEVVGHALMDRKAAEIFENDSREQKIDLRSANLPLESARHISSTQVELGFTGGTLTPREANYLSSVLQRMGLNYGLKFVSASTGTRQPTMIVDIVEVRNKP